jgi:hypothetical protein
MKPLSDEDLITKLREEQVPEPSPLFWEHLSQRVHDAVAAEPVPSRAWFSRFNVAWAGGIVAAAAVAVFAVTLSIRHEPVGIGPGAVAPIAVADAAVTGNLPALEDDASFAVMGELASEIDFEEAAASGLMVSPGSAEGAIDQMSGDEQRAVVELLQQEIKNSKSL